MAQEPKMKNKKWTHYFIMYRYLDLKLLYDESLQMQR